MQNLGFVLGFDTALLWDFGCNWPRMWKCSFSVRCRAVNQCRRLHREPGYHSWLNLFQSRQVVEWLPFSAQGISRRLWQGMRLCSHKHPTRLYSDMPFSSTLPVHPNHTDWKSYVNWFSSGNSDAVLTWHVQCSIKLRSVALLLFQVIPVPCALFCSIA